ncbi:hypothetical protein [Sphingobacterium mizutaii]|uniref:hypothetical protein n=1 Tax=Sphingobacterium mizutaii TaxID=1010 RepID=UPI002899A831|nr:hypothetical protein [Sphingobacterium mizutaii]
MSRSWSILLSRTLSEVDGHPGSNPVLGPSSNPSHPGSTQRTGPQSSIEDDKK